jgi:PLD-like domain
MVLLRKPWPAITAALKRTRRRRIVVTAFLGSGARDLLRLRADDELYTNASEAAVMCGQTDPHVLRRLVASGVRCFSVPRLHAKVYIADDTVFIGSANASQSSATKLTELCVRIDDTRLAASITAWIAELDAELLDGQRIGELEHLYEPPRGIEPTAKTSNRGRKVRNRLWLTWVEVPFEPPHTKDYRDWRGDCRGRIRTAHRYQFWEIACFGSISSGLFREARRGDQVVVVDHPTMEVYGPMRVLNAPFGSKTKEGPVRILGLEYDLDQPRVTFGRFRQALRTRNIADLPGSGLVNRQIRARRKARALREYLAGRVMVTEQTSRGKQAH